jgi:hypothetical protein
MLMIAVEDTDTIHLLNTHAEAVVSLVTLPESYKLAFQNFLKTIESNNYPKNFNTDPTSPCSRAYWAYFDAHDKLPKKRQQKRWRFLSFWSALAFGVSGTEERRVLLL